MNSIREEFPIFNKSGKELAYLDSAASAQKPARVLERLHNFYANDYANIHRGAYQLSAEATVSYETSRASIAKFLNSPDVESIIFTRGATEGVNLVAYCLESQISSGDTILTSKLEHHSNIVPWQLLAEKTGAKLVFTEIDSAARIDLDDFYSKLKEHQPKIVALTLHSNAFGTSIPAKEISDACKSAGSLILFDAAQAVVHQAIDLKELDPDFLVFSGHKLYGPNGIGVLYGRKSLLEELPPFNGGGEMIQSVTVDGSTWAKLPNKYEAGTPAIAEAIALEEAVNFVSEVGYETIQENEHKLMTKAFEILGNIDDVTLYGPNNPDEQSAIVAFNIDDVHAHDFATVADSFNVQIRAGFHCAMPALNALGLTSTARLSFGVYSQEEDLLQLEESIHEAIKIFK